MTQSSAPTRQQRARREFLRSAGLLTGVAGLALCGFLPLDKDRARRLRPPGALDEDDFLASCIKCGQCLQVCPVQAIVLGDIDDGFGVGVPHIDPRAQACDFSCDAVQCILACPTGALVYDKPAFMPSRPGARLPAPPVLKAKADEPEPTLNLKERFGLAFLEWPKSCLAVQGKGFAGVPRGENFKGKLRDAKIDRWQPQPVREHPHERKICDLCVITCPIEGAISLEELAPGRFVPVVHEACVGCGVCEMICPANEGKTAAIVVKPWGEWPKDQSKVAK
jgi:ferredoxin-type protein NapG